jgi:SAM-dependent methyltransferase
MLPLDRQNRYRQRLRQEQPGWQTSGEMFEGLTRASLTPASRVLDLGCGRGGVMELFWREVRLAVGVDPDLPSLREHRAGMPLVCGLAEALPFRAGSFDLVIGLWVLEHLPEPSRALREIHRLLTPGGRFIFLTPNALHPLLLANRYAWAFPAIQRLLVPRLYGRDEADTFRVRYRANTVGRLRALAAETGFRVDSLRTISDPTYLAFNDIFYRLSVGLERLLPRRAWVHILGEFVREGLATQSRP